MMFWRSKSEGNAVDAELARAASMGKILFAIVPPWLITGGLLLPSVCDERRDVGKGSEVGKLNPVYWNPAGFVPMFTPEIAFAGLKKNELAS